MKGEPEASTVMAWISDVAIAARNAYGFDDEYARKTVSVLEHPEDVIDTILMYPYLENNLSQGLMQAVKTPALLSQIRTEDRNRNSAGLGTMTALRTMRTIIDYFRVLEEDEDGLSASALENVRLNLVPGRDEDQCLDECFSKRDLQFSQYLRVKNRSRNDYSIALSLLSNIKELKGMVRDVAERRSLSQSAKTTEWLRGRIKRKLLYWRSERNRNAATTAASENASTPGYPAPPAPNRGRPNGASQVGNGRGRSTSPNAWNQQPQTGRGRGNGMAAPADVKAKIGTPR